MHEGLWMDMDLLLQYRMAKDYTDFKYLYPRTMDKLSIALIVMTLCKALCWRLSIQSHDFRVHASSKAYTDSTFLQTGRLERSYESITLMETLLTALFSSNLLTTLV